MATVHASSSTAHASHHHHHHHQHHHHKGSSNNNNTSNNSNTMSNAKDKEREKEREKEKKLSMYKVEPYKTELRRDHIARRKELTRHHLLNREKTQGGRQGEGGVEGGGQRRGQHGKTVSRNVVTIDTHKARGSIDVLRMVIRDLGWREFPFMRRDHNCDVMWHAVNFYDQQDIYSGQVNKYPGALETFQKVNLFRWLEFMKSLFPEEYDFFPRTWLLPQQFTEFASEVRTMQEKKSKHKPVFIVKPSEGSQGDGIYLLKDPQHYVGGNGRTHVVQEYLNNILLLERFKFDLRVYVILKCLDPLEFHICKEGLARFSTVPYEQPNNKNMAETFMHLTNYSLNKKSSDFKISDKEDEGSKRKLTAVFAQLERVGHDTEALWTRIEQLVAKTLIAVVGELKVEMQAAVPSGKPGPTCFQILGFDVLVMKNLTPMLLEVNSNPSLSITEEHETATGGVEYLISSKDEDVKRKLVRDTLILIAPKNKYTRKRRKRRKQRNCRGRRRDEEEPMDVDGSLRRRENDISIRYMDIDDDKGMGGGRQRSIFDDSDYNSSSGSNYHIQHQQPKKFVRNETCRVFIEGEGEVLFDEDGPSNPKYFSHYRESQLADGNTNNNNNTNSPSKKDFQRKDTNDRLPSVFLKSGELPADIIMVEDGEDDGNDAGPPRPLPFDLSLLDSSDEEDEEEESSLKEIFPTVYSELYEEQRIVERLADIFIACLGVKGCLRLGPTMFRLFARKCRLNRKGITNAAIDILYIDMQRRWEYMNPDRTSGLGFLGFVSACYELARRRFYAPTKHETLKSLVDFCSANIKIHNLQNYGGSPSSSMTASVSPYNTISTNPAASLGLAGASTQQQQLFLSPHYQTNLRRQRHLGRRERHKTSLTLFPRSTITSLEGEESEAKTRNRTVVEQQNLMTSLGGANTGNSVAFGTRRQQSFMGDLSTIMRERQARNYLPRTLTHANIFPENDE